MAKVTTGIEVGRLTAITAVRYHQFPGGQRHSIWLCSCRCGRMTLVDSNNLSTSHTLSCGCLQKEQQAKGQVRHGHTSGGKWTPIYGVWCGMLQRCNDPNSISYSRYGARGIKVLWGSFEEFNRDMGPTWERGLKIERIDNNGNYCKENCKWATQKEQSLNTSRNVWIEHGGNRKTLSQWADGIGMQRTTLKRRLNLGWSVGDAITTPIRK